MLARKEAKDPPDGPVPTIRTSVSIAAAISGPLFVEAILAELLQSSRCTVTP